MPATRLQVSPAVHRREPRGERRDRSDRPSATRSASPGPSRSSATGASNATAASPARRPRPPPIDAHLASCGELEDLDLLLHLLERASLLDRIDAGDASRARADARLRILIVDTCQADDRLKQLDETLDAPCPMSSARSRSRRAPRDGRSRENSVHGFFTAALLRQLRRPRRPGVRSLEPARRVRSRVGRSGRPASDRSRSSPPTAPAGCAFRSSRRARCRSSKGPSSPVLGLWELIPVGAYSWSASPSLAVSVAGKMRRASVRMRTSSSSVRPGL